jgi:hypothetical protein
MVRRVRRGLICALLSATVCSPWPVVAAVRPAPQGQGVVATSAATTIVGTAWESDNTPIPFARLRLRTLGSGRIHAAATADDQGQFAFHGVDPGSYVIELVNEAGRVLTVGQKFTVSQGETLATFVRLGTKVPWFQGFFGNAAAAVAATAAATGITALAPDEVRPVSARR